VLAAVRPRGTLNTFAAPSAKPPRRPFAFALSPTILRQIVNIAQK
jgi:hypothetical protein